MAIPSSGPITFAQIQTEFGGSNPIGLNEYYRGGAYVPNIPSNSGVPTSGAISVSNFYGTNAAFVFNQTISSNTANYNLSSAMTAAGWNGTTTAFVNVTVGSGVWVYSNDTATPGFIVPSLPAASTVAINNYGYITGAGGQGGQGGDYNFSACTGTVGGNGIAGGNALQIYWNTTVNNYANFIAGGGGGGGGGGSSNGVYTYLLSAAGGGGGGGAGGLNAGGAGASSGCYVYIIIGGTPYYNNPTASYGSAASGGSGGAGGNGGVMGYGSGYGGAGGTGGGWGAAGNTGGASSGANQSFSPGSGGAAGRAILTTSGTLTYNALGGAIYGAY
jgi:hypothetical protein